jgi:hypothetical protein
VATLHIRARTDTPRSEQAKLSVGAVESRIEGACDGAFDVAFEVPSVGAGVGASVGALVGGNVVTIFFDHVIYIQTSCHWSQSRLPQPVHRPLDFRASTA